MAERETRDKSWCGDRGLSSRVIGVLVRMGGQKRQISPEEDVAAGAVGSAH